MANPFLILGGVAVGIITAGIGVLSVPGWVDSANDSAAINDLGNIRAAESAAILHMGEYTDDFAVLHSGELGVKVQKSDGVTFVGLDAESNESWCAVTQSRSGKFFAASNVQAAIATSASSAHAAMIYANCDATTGGAVDTIIREAVGTTPGNPATTTPVDRDGDGAPDGYGPDLDGDGAGDSTDPVPVGIYPGNDVDDAHWAGEKNPEAGGGTGGGTVAPADLEAVAAVGSPWGVAYTANGVYLINTANQILRGGPDGHAHSVTISGDAAGAAFNRNLRIDADANGNIYAVGTNGDWRQKIYRIAPDNTSTDITPDYEYTGVGQAPTMNVYGLTTSPDGTVYYVGDGAATGTSSGGYAEDGWVRGLWKQTATHDYELVVELPGSMNVPSISGVDADSAGNVWINGSSTGLYKVDASGTITLVATSLPGGAGFGSTYDVVVTNDGSTLYVGANNTVYRITYTGSSTVAALQDYSEFEDGVPANAWSGAYGLTVDSSGNVFFADANFGGRVLKLDAAGTVTVEVRD